MKAGRELDMLIAEKVFGRERMLARFGFEHGEPEYHWGYPMGHDRADHYSTNISAAWKVVEKLCNWDVDDNMLVLEGQGPDIEKKELPDGEAQQWWKADIAGIAGHNVGEADTAPLAICLAALRAVGVQIDED